MLSSALWAAVSAYYRKPRSISFVRLVTRSFSLARAAPILESVSRLKVWVCSCSLRSMVCVSFVDSSFRTNSRSRLNLTLDSSSPDWSLSATDRLATSWIDEIYSIMYSFAFWISCSVSLVTLPIWLAKRSSSCFSWASLTLRIASFSCFYLAESSCLRAVSKLSCIARLSLSISCYILVRLV